MKDQLKCGRQPMKCKGQQDRSDNSILYTLKLKFPI